jgi:hypothetical protein
MPLQRINLKQMPTKQTTLKHPSSRQCLPKQFLPKQRLDLVLLCATLPLVLVMIQVTVQAMAAQTTSQSDSQTPRGIAPRNAATDYAAHASPENLQIGASLLTHKELKKALSTDVNQCCVVVEVAFYPAKDNFVKISRDDFMLRETGMDTGTRPSTADVLAARLEVIPAKPDREHTPGVTTSSDIGYERTSGNNPQDPTQPAGRGGIYQRQSVGVGIPNGGKIPNTPEASAAAGNRQAIAAELNEKGLPETSSWQPVAGYLYFAVPKKKKDDYELVYVMGDKKVVLPLK